MNRRGFSLIETLVVVAILAVLLAAVTQIIFRASRQMRSTLGAVHQSQAVTHLERAFRKDCRLAQGIRIEGDAVVLQFQEDSQPDSLGAITYRLEKKTGNFLRERAVGSQSSLSSFRIAATDFHPRWDESRRLLTLQLQLTATKDRALAPGLPKKPWSLTGHIGLAKDVPRDDVAAQPNVEPGNVEQRPSEAVPSGPREPRP